jgi:hypothetical protein
VVKCSGVLQCSDGLSNKVSNIIRRLMDNMKLLLICILLLSHSLGSIDIYMSKAGVYFIRPSEPYRQIVTSKLGPMLLAMLTLKRVT